MNTPAAPCIGFGSVWHRRLRPIEHQFRYRCYFLLLPMRSLRERASPALKRNRRGWLSFHDADHGAGGDDALAWFEQLLAREGVRDADGEVWLQTFPRVLGYVFKPVSFWYAQRADGSLAAVLAEVNNTFGERHGYLLAGPGLNWGAERAARKVFHVSPFCGSGGDYGFRFERLAAADGQPTQLLARVDLHDDQGALLQTSVGGAIAELSPATVRRAVLGMPLMTLGVVLRIHWQALRLWLKRVPFFAKPDAPSQFVSR
ncbi:DUF1365 domain-containing protein [Roseateles violae]|uniref:DUF1365 domain-containing protein n=1 Tax=Roseateles violae TaxID=3058042 RepID=A0ABT8DQ02_9BURK|nr:DUF1365 domain-containing protein [Pelomonas sp. PFR6]MDN3920091.1 DUF1365 domain-containing protein [Pelomonas sp. PFR6]